MKTGYLDQHIEIQNEEVKVIYSMVDGPIVEVSDRMLWGMGYQEIPKHIKTHHLFLIAKNESPLNRGVYINYVPKVNLLYLIPFFLYRLLNGFQKRLLWTLVIWNLWPRGKIYPKWRFWKDE